LLTPRIIEFNSLKNELQAITNQRTMYKQLYENPIEYEEVLNKYNDIVKKVPKNKGLSGFLIDIDKWANEKDITVISIYPQSITTEDIAEVAINVIPFEIKINGDYDLLLDFISELENYSRISRIYGMELRAATDLNATSSLLWELVIKVSLYYLPA
jgi:Tfp pilus assembly protein PilO